MIRNLALLAALSLGVLATTGCEPWGKPDEPETPALQVTDFRTLYGKNCAGCHGQNGNYGPGRILNDPLYLKFIPREEMRKILVYGRWHGSMPAWSLSRGGPLTDKQIDAITDGIYAAWGRPFDLHGNELPPYSADVSSGNAADGKKLFARNCYMCHGPGARVGVVSSPSYLQLASNQMLRTSIVVGRSDLGMPYYLNLKAGHALTSQDVSDLVTYLASLRPPGPAGDDAHTEETESTSNGSATGSKGSGNGPGSPQKDQLQGAKHVNSSQSGGTIEQRKEQH